MNSEFSDPMDSSLQQLERELQSLTPVAPSRELLRSLHARMEPAAPSPQVNKVHSFPWRRMMAPAAAAAAAVAVMSINNNRRSGTGTGKSMADGHTTDTPAYKWEPMPMRSEYRALLDAGYVINDNQEYVPQVLMNRLDHHEWRNASENSSIRLTIPRVVTPAGYETNDPHSVQFH